MHLFVNVTRTLVILLLTLRVLAAPLAMRPEPFKTPARFHLVARVCAWPAQRPQRSLSLTSLAPCFRGGRLDNAEGRGNGSVPPNLLSMSRALLSRLLGPEVLGPSSRRLPFCLRC
jgi:hypothetical protein